MPLRLFGYGQSVVWDLITPLQNMYQNIYKFIGNNIDIYKTQWNITIKYWMYNQSINSQQ